MRWPRRCTTWSWLVDRQSRISDGTWTYGYDLDNRLRTASRAAAPAVSASLLYDAQGRLRQTAIGANTLNLLYDGADLVAEYNATASTLLRRYVHGPGTDEPIVWYEGAGTTQKHWLYTDHLGSVVATANAAGARTNLYSYGPFGEPNVSTGLRFRYTGQQLISELGLYHYKARFYSAKLGRFLQTDPIGYADDRNLYAYVGNDPVNKTDPTGEFAWFVPAVTRAIGGVAGGAGYVIGCYVTGSELSLKNFRIAVGVGAAAGAAAPYTATTLAGAALTGAFANVTQGAITAVANSSAYSNAQAASDAVFGAVGGVVGGAYTRSTGYGKVGTALPGAVGRSNDLRDLAKNVTATRPREDQASLRLAPLPIKRHLHFVHVEL